MPLGRGEVSWINAPCDIAVVAVASLTAPGHENQSYPVTGPEALGGAKVGAVLFQEPAASPHIVTYLTVYVDQAEQAMIAKGMPEPLAVQRATLVACWTRSRRWREGPAHTLRQFVWDYAATTKGV